MDKTDERLRFEKWYVENHFNYQRMPLGSRDCSLQWEAWEAALRQVRSLNAQQDTKGWIDVQRQVPAIGQRIIGRNAQWGMWEEQWNGNEPLGAMVAWIPFPDNAPAAALAQVGIAMEVKTFPTTDGRAVACLVPATSREKHQVFKSVEDLADWLDSFYESDADGAITGRKWGVTQRAARLLRAQHTRDVILLYKPELTVDTSTSSNPELATEYTLSVSQTEAAIEKLIEREQDQLNDIAREIWERMVEDANTPD